MSSQRLFAGPAVYDLAVLTDDQRAVLRCIARGHADHEIARVLGLAQRRVLDEVAEILRRLDLPDRVAAVVFAHEAGMLHLPFPR
ncbi:response regulator transcription factor [Lentzea sp. CA-135723]|uniref:response regulator transcription factor n=1 Tax=Lentzea sp. CA-135723 TaxID=3239950 RepID=UPI003D9217BB